MILAKAVGFKVLGGGGVASSCGARVRWPGVEDRQEAVNVDHVRGVAVCGAAG